MAVSFNCEKINVPCTKNAECKILCQRVSDISRVNEVSLHTCRNGRCIREGIPENIADLALGDLNDLRKNNYRGLETFEARYVKRHSDDFVLKRALYYLELFDNYIEEGDDDDISISHLKPGGKYDEDADDDDHSPSAVLGGEEEGEEEERQKWKGKRLEKDAELFVPKEEKESAPAAARTSNASRDKLKSNKKVFKFSDIKNFHGIISSSSSSSSVETAGEGEEGGGGKEEISSKIESVFEMNDEDSDLNEKYLESLHLSSNLVGTAAEIPPQKPPREPPRAPSSSSSLHKLPPPPPSFRFLCNEEMGAGFEISRFTLFENDKSHEIPICLCLHPEKLFGPACKWRTNYDVTDYDLWEKSGGKIFPLRDNIDDYNKALDFCRQKNINLVTYFDSFRNTYFCKPKAERVQEILTNNSEGNIPNIIESQLLTVTAASSTSSPSSDDGSGGSRGGHGDGDGDGGGGGGGGVSASKLRLNIFEYSLADVLFNTPTYMNK
nr:MAG: wsv306-like protein [Porcellio scaber clopovirus]